jgi:hypothetical protein
MRGRAPGGLKLQAPVAAIADIGGVGQARGEVLVGLDVAPVVIEQRRAEVHPAVERVQRRADLVVAQVVGLEHAPVLGRRGQAPGVEAAGAIAFRAQGVDHAAARQVALDRDLRRESAERGLAIQVARLTGRRRGDVGAGVDGGLERPSAQGDFPAATQVVGRLAVEGVLVQPVLALFVVVAAGDIAGAGAQVRVAFLDAGGQEAADHPAQPAHGGRGVDHVLDHHAHAGGFVVDAQFKGLVRELAERDGGVVAAGVLVGDVAGHRLELAPVARAADLDRGLGQAVAVDLAHLVGAAGAAGRQGDVLGVLGPDALQGRAQLDLPVAQVHAPSRAAASARGLVDVGQAQVDVVEIAAVDIVIGRDPRGRDLTDRRVDDAFGAIAVRAGLGGRDGRAD